MMDARPPDPLQVCRYLTERSVLIAFPNRECGGIRTRGLHDRRNLFYNIGMRARDVLLFPHISEHIVEFNRGAPVLSPHAFPLPDSDGLRETGFVKLPVQVWPFRHLSALQHGPE